MCVSKKKCFLVKYPTPWSAIQVASASKCLRCLPDSYCRGGRSLVDAKSLTTFFYFFPVLSDFLRRRRRRRTASHRYRIRARVVGVFVSDMQRFDSRADAQTPDVADQEVDIIALHWPLVTLETRGHHQRYPGPSTALYGPAGSVRTSCIILCIAATLYNIEYIHIYYTY